MLVTRCPHCETAFRIQAAHLEQAEGHVRCGRCANVFDAYQELRQSLNPTLTDLAEAAGPQAAQDQSKQTVADDLVFSAAEVDELDRVLRAEEEDEDAVVSEVETPPTITEEQPSDDQEIVGAQTSDGDNERLEFNLPSDQWQDFFSDTVVGEDQVPAISDTGVEWVVLGEVGVDDFELEHPPIKAEPVEEEEDADLAAFFTIEADADKATERPTTAGEEIEVVEESGESPQGHVMDLGAVARQSHHESEHQPSMVEGLFRDLEEEPVLTAPRKPTYGYSSAALLLVLALCGQYLHYNRHALATHASVGPWLTSGYNRLGITLTPTWNLDQYQINRWVAASDNTDEDNPSLKITAQISNLGPQVQPYPLIQLELKDRWDETVAARVFAPEEYLTGDTATGLLGAGEHAQAELKVLDPGQDAYGFELDVCIHSDNQQLRCANEPER